MVLVKKNYLIIKNRNFNRYVTTHSSYFIENHNKDKNYYNFT